MSFRRLLEARSHRWVDSGVITPEQRERILAIEPVEDSTRLRLIPIVSLLGAALLVLGAVLVVSRNWDEIPRMVKLSAGVALLVSVLGAGYWMRFGRPHAHRTGEALMLVGSGIFLANLALVSQQYQLEFNPARLVLLFLLAVVPMSYLLGSRAYALVASVAFAAWLVLEMLRSGSPIETSGARIWLPLVGVGAWLVVTGLAHRLTRYAHLAGPIELPGAFLLFLAVYILGFYRYFGIQSALGFLPMWLLLLVPLSLVFATAAFTLWMPAEGRASAAKHPAALTAVGVLALVLAWTVLAGWFPRHGDEERLILWTAGYWVLALALTVALAWLGLALHRNWWLNAALIFLGVFVLTRYFDLFADYAQTGALFMGAGLLLLLLALGLERMRRELRERAVSAAPGGAT
jgi:uncharacterized membrane protein